jgi:hypothetical protein
MTASRTRPRSNASRLRVSENRARFRRAHSREFGLHAASGHTPGTAWKGWSFSRVPSLVLGWLPEGALCARLSNRAFTVNIRQAREKWKLFSIRLFTRLREPDGLTDLTGFLQKLLYARVVKWFLRKCHQTRQFWRTRQPRGCSSSERSPIPRYTAPRSEWVFVMPRSVSFVPNAVEVNSDRSPPSVAHCL